MSRHCCRSLLVSLVASAATCSPAWSIEPTAPQPDPLLEGFSAPPPSARPRVWWHWMNGNISQDGIEKDLQWMKRAGIGGLQNFDANLLTPQVVPKRLSYMTPEWKDAFRFAAKTADQLGLEMAIAASPGWSETGGPWVTPEHGMKKLVWSIVDTGSRRGNRYLLPTPPSVAGLFGDMPKDGDVLARLTGARPFEAPSFYADVAVFAYPIAAPANVPGPRATSAGKEIDAAALTDASLTTAVTIDRPTADRPAIVELEYPRPVTIRSATVALPNAIVALMSSTLSCRLEVATGADTWRSLTDVVLMPIPTTVSIPTTTGTRFRLVIGQKAGPSIDIAVAPGVDLSLLAALFATKPTLDLAQFRLWNEPKTHMFEAKAGFEVLPDYYSVAGPPDSDGRAVAPATVVDLTDRMKPDGTLDWTPPRGDWRIVRLGYSLTGKTNHPATAEATGLEVDKFDRRAVRDYLEHYLGMYREVVGPELMGSRGVQALLTDSIEFGPSNWTPGLIEHFQRLRGYSPKPFLPALTGAVVGSRAETEAFLFDFRRTLGDLLASEHYGTVAEVAHEHGMKVYGESFEGGRPALGSDIQLRKYADYPMAALWTFRRDKAPKPEYLADMKGAASTAHAYGRAVVAAESMTSALSPWAHAPSDLRRIIDLEFASGINRPVIHTSVHQPVDDKQPGLSLSFFGQFFNRHETWAEMARPWTDYIARNSYLLQQGANVADVAYFYGEDAPLMHVFPDVPKQYAYDFVDADLVLNSLQVKDGDLVTPGGARYRVLYLGGSSATMTLPVLRRLASLVDAGATVIGSAPTVSPAMSENGAEYTTLVRRLWPGESEAPIGARRVIASNDVETVLKARGVAPDFALVRPAPDSAVLFVHRRVNDADVYFVNNRLNREETLEARFRVVGRVPELWRADTGRIAPLSYRIDGDATVVPLAMDAEDSYFVVFRKPATATSLNVNVARPSMLMSLDGAWDVTFQAGRGAPDGVRSLQLASLAENADAGIKYFSGIATYRKRLSLPKAIGPKQRVVLDLGQVGDIAEVRVNGRNVGHAWHAPYRLDLGDALRKGPNEIEIRVANLWVNRLIGDKQPGATPVASTTIATYRPDAPLRPSGLIGPVRLLATPATAH